MLTDLCVDASHYLRTFYAEARPPELEAKEDDLIRILHERGAPLDQYATARDGLLHNFGELSKATVLTEDKERLRPLVEDLSESAQTFANELKVSFAKDKRHDPVLGRHVAKLEEIAAEAQHWLTPEAQEQHMAFTRTCRQV